MGYLYWKTQANKRCFSYWNYRLFFNGGSILHYITLQHVFLIPISLISLIAIYLIGTKRKDLWKFSMMQIIIFFIIGKLFTPIEQNINFIFMPPSFVSFLTPPYGIYPLFWLFYCFIMVFVTNLLLTKLGQLRKYKNF